MGWYWGYYVNLKLKYHDKEYVIYDMPFADINCRHACQEKSHR